MFWIVDFYCWALVSSEATVSEDKTWVIISFFDSILGLIGERAAILIVYWYLIRLSLLSREILRVSRLSRAERQRERVITASVVQPMARGYESQLNIVFEVPSRDSHSNDQFECLNVWMWDSALIGLSLVHWLTHLLSQQYWCLFSCQLSEPEVINSEH